MNAVLCLRAPKCALCGLYTLIKRNFCATQLRNNVKDVKETATERKAERERVRRNRERLAIVARLCAGASVARAMPTECAQLGIGLGLGLGRGLGLGTGPLRCSWLGAGALLCALCLASVKLDAITARDKQLNEDDSDDDDSDNKAALQ